MPIDVIQAPVIANEGHRPEPAELSEEQRNRSVIIAWDAPFIKNYSFPQYNPDALIASKGYDELDQLRSMSAYSGAMSVKKDAVLYKLNPRACVKSAVRDQEDAEYNEALEIAKSGQYHLSHILDAGDQLQDLRAYLYEKLDACHYGFMVTEVNLRYVEKGPYKGQWGLRRLTVKDPKQIGFNLDPYTLSIASLTNYIGFFGGLSQAPIPPEKTLIYTYRPRSGLPYGWGDARTCYKHWWMLDVLEKVHAIAMEVHGSPHYVVYAPTSDATAMEAIRTAIDSVRQGANLVLPEFVKAELQQLAGGSLDSFINAKRWHKQEIAFAVLLQELTTSQGTGVGSYALGDVHQHTQEYGLAHVRRDIEGQMNNLLRRLTRYNYGEDKEHLSPVFDLGEWDAAEKNLVADFWGKLIKSGVVWPREPQIRERLNIAPIDKDSAKEMEDDKAWERDIQKQELQMRMISKEPAAASE